MLAYIKFLQEVACQNRPMFHGITEKLKLALFEMVW